MLSGAPTLPAAQPKMKGRTQLDRQTDPITSDFSGQEDSFQEEEAHLVAAGFQRR